MFKSIGESLTENSEALEFLNRMAKLHSPNGDIYDGGRNADEILTEIDSKRLYKPSGYDCPICLNKGGKSSYNPSTRQSWWEPCKCMQNKKETTEKIINQMQKKCKEKEKEERGE